MVPILIDITQPIIIDNIQFGKLSVDSGGPQRFVHGPLFLLFISDQYEYVISEIKLFADDCLLYRTINNHKTLFHKINVILINQQSNGKILSKLNSRQTIVSLSELPIIDRQFEHTTKHFFNN